MTTYPIAGKVDQLAFISRSADDTLAIKRTFGLQDADWTEDFVYAKGTVFGDEGANHAILLFNYDLGIELEILQYVDGPNYADGHSNGTVFASGRIESQRMCHIGIHHDGVGEVPTFDYPIAQQVETQSHTNRFVIEKGRHYRYTIYDTFAELGVYLKVIERIHN